MRRTPLMLPVRKEMRTELCHGLPSEKYGEAGGTPCGRFVEIHCSSCHVHRCRECNPGNACLSCLRLGLTVEDRPPHLVVLRGGLA